MSHNALYSPYGAFELKAKYQRNLLTAAGFVYVPVLLFIAVYLYIGRAHPQDEAVSNDLKPDSTVHVVMPTAETPQPAKRLVYGSLNPYERQHAGFMGMHGFRIIPNALPKPVHAEAPQIFTHEPAPNGLDTVQSYSDIMGDTGIGVYASEVDLLQPPETAPVDSIIVPCSVLVAVKPEYPFIAREREKEGAAGIIVCVDEYGKVSLFPDDIIRQFQEKNLPVEQMTVKVDGQKRQFNYVVTLEEPAGWFFAKKVAEILPKWVFEPSTVNGQPVKSLIPIGNAFCLTDECHNEYEVLRNYKQYAK